GFLGLASARRISSPNSKGSTTWHYYYNTTIQTPTHAIPAELRIYSPPDDVAHPDYTIAHVVAKAHLAANGTALLDAISVAPVPGDPEDDSYEDRVPDLPYPFIFALGVVQKSEHQSDDGT
ncbi:hypothetical protein PHLGIDRAFT_54813, partial [Phlebiopsis gigantea 11061_1 CR5-6]